MKSPYTPLHDFFSVLAILVLATASTVSLCAQSQSTLPPTSIPRSPAIKILDGPSVSQLPSAQSLSRTPSGTAGTDISWNGTQLKITANGTDLNTLFRELTLRSGLQITGMVPGERIFGTYGPGTMEDVVSALLKGMPVNMLLIQRSGQEHSELILTPRVGGVTPPTAAQNDTPNLSPGIQPNINGLDRNRVTNQPAASSPAPGSPGYPNQNATTPPTTPDGSPPASPNGVKTPQEIFDQLQRLRSQQVPTQN